MTAKTSIVLALIAGCNLEPRVDDPPDAPKAPDTTTILPPGSDVPSVATNPELLVQIRINDGLVDGTLMMNNGVVVRGTGKAAGVTVRFWNFGAAPVETGIAVAAPLYVFGTLEGTVFTPLPNHPALIDTLPGDTRYSPIRRVINVPVNASYAGGLITTMAALQEAVALGQVGEPVSDGTWINMPVVLPGTTLEVSTGVTMMPKQVYGRGYRIDAFELGTSLGRQPFRTGFVPLGQASGLQTGVATGVPPTLPVAIDSQPVFQYGIPTAPPGTVFSYSPLATDVTVRLANGVAPTAITSDTDLYKRSATGTVTAYFTETVSSFTVQTTVNNIQLQFADGAP